MLRFCWNWCFAKGKKKFWIKISGKLHVCYRDLPVPASLLPRLQVWVPVESGAVVWRGNVSSSCLFFSQWFILRVLPSVCLRTGQSFSEYCQPRRPPHSASVTPPRLFTVCLVSREATAGANATGGRHRWIVPKLFPPRGQVLGAAWTANPRYFVGEFSFR